MFHAVRPRWGTHGPAQELEGPQGWLQGRQKSSKIARMAVAELGGDNFGVLLFSGPRERSLRLLVVVYVYRVACFYRVAHTLLPGSPLLQGSSRVTLQVSQRLPGSRCPAYIFYRVATG